MKSFGWLLIVCVLVALVGCGGSGSPSPSPFAGSYAGAWVEPSEVGPDNIAEGTLELTVLPGGALTGQYVQTAPSSLSGTISGRVYRDGIMRFTLFSGSSRIRHDGFMEFSGTHVRGSFNETGVGTGGFFPTFDLAPISAPAKAE